MERCLSAHGWIKAILFRRLEYKRRAIQIVRILHAGSFATRLARRDTFRLPVFLWITPLVTPRMISGSAALKAARALPFSPVAIASSTARVSVRIRLLRA